MDDVKFNKILVFINGLVPLALLVWDAIRGNAGANPVEFFIRTTGVLTLIFLLITLTISPLRKIFGWNNLIKFRRMLGLYTFFYGFLHFSSYFGFDRGLSVSGTLGDIWLRPFIAVGVISFFLMIPLAITSTNSMIKRLGGEKWQKLHRLTYPIAIGGVIHYWMIVKSDLTYPFLFAFILSILLGYRYYVNKPKLQTLKN
ncbi:MAG: sulfite oxidase heme-binding subunit YedZ [Pyrinomonadaceae bacterium]